MRSLISYRCSMTSPMGNSSSAAVFRARSFRFSRALKEVVVAVKVLRPPMNR